MARAIHTYKTFLMIEKAGVYEKLIDIKDYPDLTEPPDTIEVTHLGNRAHTNIFGLLTSGTAEFMANYDIDDYLRLEKLQGDELNFSVWFGGTGDTDATLVPTGEDGTFTFKGMLSISVVGKGTNDVREMKVALAKSSDVVVSKN